MGKQKGATPYQYHRPYIKRHIGALPQKVGNRRTRAHTPLHILLLPPSPLAAALSLVASCGGLLVLALGAAALHQPPGCAHTHCRLEGVVDPPLQPGQGTDHDDTGAQTLGEEVAVAEVLRDLPKALARVGRLALQGHQRIRGVRDNRADDPGKVSRGEGDRQLGRLVIGTLGLGEHVLVEKLDNALEEEELGHGVRDLPTPQGHHASEGERCRRPLSHHLAQSRPKVGRPGPLRRGLHLHLDHLHGAQRDVCKELCRGRARQPDRAGVHARVVLPRHVHVQVLEELVEPELAQPLGGVPEQGGQPALPDALGARALLRDHRLQPREQALVLLRADLHVALHHVQRAHRGVSQPAAQHAAQAALQVVRRVVRALGLQLASIPGLRHLRGGTVFFQRGKARESGSTRVTRIK
eukprot:RCo013623